MLIGVPKETKDLESRVALLPDAVHELVARGHQALVETAAGAGVGADDDAYRAAGAEIAPRAAAVYENAELIVKVKEPQAPERKMLRPGQLLFAYLHLAPDPDGTRELVESGATCIAYETITSPRGGLPLLVPMSAVGGRLAVQAGAWALERPHGGRGVLLGGVPGVPPAKVVVLGVGTVGAHATEVAVGMGAQVSALDINPAALDAHWRRFGAATATVYATRQAVEHCVLEADLVIGGVLVPGGAAPKLVGAETVKRMKPGAVVVDVAIDQGGCFETSRPTTHSDPVYTVDEVVHYCVTNIPGAAPHTATRALNNTILPYVLRLADQGLDALRADPHFCAGLSVHAGQVTCRKVAEDLGFEYVEAGAACGPI